MSQRFRIVVLSFSHRSLPAPIRPAVPSSPGLVDPIRCQGQSDAVVQPKLKVLLAPAAMRWDPNAGSEHAFTYEVAELLSRRSWDFVVLTEEAVPGAVGDVHILGRRQLEHAGGLGIPFRIARFVSNWPVQEVRLIHHGLPFALDRTFSLLPFLSVTRNLPFVVGPIQPLQQWAAPDESWAKPSRRLALPARIDGAVGPWVGRALASPLARLSAATLRRATHVVATGSSVFEALVGRGIPPRRLSIIRPPVAAMFFEAGETRFHQGTEVSVLQNQPLRCITVGHLNSRKGVDLLLESIAFAVHDGAELQLTLVGDGPARDALERAARHAGISGRVTFLGSLPRASLPKLLLDHDVFTTMSRSEGSPMAVAEAMASGLPVLSAANVGARDFINDGETGRLVDVGDSRAMADCLVSLASNRELLGKMATKAHRHAVAVFHPDAVADAWERIYYEALEQSPQRQDRGI